MRRAVRPDTDIHSRRAPDVDPLDHHDLPVLHAAEDAAARAAPIASFHKRFACRDRADPLARTRASCLRRYRTLCRLFGDVAG